MKTIFISFLVFSLSISVIAQTSDSINKSTNKKFSGRIKEMPGSKRKQRGFTNISEIDIADGKVTVENYGTTNQFSIGLQTINGYQFNRYWSIGIGIGFVGYYQYTIPNEMWKGTSFMTPLFVDIRVNMEDRPFSPFFSLDGGYTFSFITSDFSGGPYINPNVGIKFFISPKTAINLSFGYRYHENTFNMWHFSYYSRHIKLNETLNLLSLKFGFTF